MNEPRQYLLDTYYLELQSYPRITTKQEAELAERIAKGDELALEKLILSNLRLVVKIARDYERVEMADVMDLISEGNIGLAMAAKKFNPRYGAKFSTYASWWIKQRIKRYLSTSTRTIRIPCHAIDKHRKIATAASRLEEELQREPTPEEIANETDISVKSVICITQSKQLTHSLDYEYGTKDEDGDALKDHYPDDKPTPAQVMESNESHEAIREMVAKFSDRERDIIESRFGLTGNKPQTLEAVASRYGITRERVRQIESAVLKILKVKMEIANRI